MRSTGPSYYDVLGVSPTATAEEIDEAWKLLVRANHPDHASPDERDAATARTAAINEARDVLRDPARRARHDRLSGSGPLRQTPRMSVEDAVDALIALRRKRQVERVRVTGAVVAGLAAVAYTVRTLKLG